MRLRNAFRFASSLTAIACILHVTTASAQDAAPPLPLPPPAAAAPAAPPAATEAPPAPPAAAADTSVQPTPSIAEPYDLRPTPREPGSRADDVRFSEANADRVILGSTAETHPKGTVFFSDYELFLLQIGYAFSDDLQLSLSTVPPLVKDQPYFFDISFKANVVRQRVVRAAIMGSLDIIAGVDTSYDAKTVVGGRLGGAVQFCFEDACRSSISLSGGGIAANAIREVVPVYAAIGFTGKVSSLVSILVEPALYGALATGTENSDALLALDYGIRLSGKNFGVDLTFIKPLAVTGGLGDDQFLAGYPFVAFTYRSDGDDRTQAPAAAKAGRALSPAFGALH